MTRKHTHRKTATSTILAKHFLARLMKDGVIKDRSDTRQKPRDVEAPKVLRKP
jgi:hypothetical protein